MRTGSFFEFLAEWFPIVIVLFKVKFLILFMIYLNT